MDEQLQAEVMLVGEALVDEFAERPVAGGAPLNVARSLAALGLPALLVARLGLCRHLDLGLGAGTHGTAVDAGARLVLASMRRFGLSRRGLQFDAGRATGRVSVLEEGSAHAFHIHPDAAWDRLDTAPALALLESHRPRLLYFGSLARRAPASRQCIQRLAEAARGLRSLCYLDLNLREGAMDVEVIAECLGQADWLKLNDAELLQVQRWFGAGGLDPLAPAASLQRPVAALLRRFGVQRLVLTRGAAGYACFGPAGELLAEGAGRQDLTLVDTVGAGDAFSAMLLAAVLHDLPLEQGLALANAYAAAICGQRGPVPDQDSFFQPWRSALGNAGVIAA